MKTEESISDQEVTTELSRFQHFKTIWLKDPIPPIGSLDVGNCGETFAIQGMLNKLPENKCPMCWAIHQEKIAKG